MSTPTAPDHTHRQPVATIRLLPEVDRTKLADLSFNDLCATVQGLSDFWHLAVMSAQAEGKGIREAVADFCDKVAPHIYADPAPKET